MTNAGGASAFASERAAKVIRTCGIGTSACGQHLAPNTTILRQITLGARAARDHILPFRCGAARSMTRSNDDGLGAEALWAAIGLAVLGCAMIAAALVLWLT